MNEANSEKDLLLLMLTKMNEQLEELDSVLEASFSGIRGHLFSEEAEKLAAAGRKVSRLENQVNTISFLGDFSGFSSVKKQTPSLKFDIGFH